MLEMLQVVWGRQATESSLGGQGVKAVLYHFFFIVLEKLMTLCKIQNICGFTKKLVLPEVQHISHNHFQMTGTLYVCKGFVDIESCILKMKNLFRYPWILYICWLLSIVLQKTDCSETSPNYGGNYCVH